MSMSFEPTPQELAFFAKLEVKESIYPRIKRRRAADRVLTAASRKRLPDSDFAIPETRSYPIYDKIHARAALQRVSQHGTPAQIRRVRAAVAKRWPDIEQAEKGEYEGEPS